MVVEGYATASAEKTRSVNSTRCKVPDGQLGNDLIGQNFRQAQIIICLMSDRPIPTPVSGRYINSF